MRADQAYRLILLQHGDLAFQLMGQPLIVRIDKRYERASGFADGAIPGGRRPAVPLRHRNTSMHISFKDLHGVVGGTVVYGIYGEILMGLGQDTGESTVYI